MKKILTLFAVAIMAVAAYAGIPADRFSKAELRPGATQRSLMSLDQMRMNIENNVEMPGMIQKSCTIDGKTWKVYILFEGDMSDMVASSWLFASAIANANVIFMTDYDSNSAAADKYYYQYCCCWPTYTLINMMTCDEQTWNDKAWEVDNRRLSFEDLIDVSAALKIESSFRRGADQNILQPWYYEGEGQNSAVTGWFCFAGGGLHKGQQMTDLGANSLANFQDYTAPAAGAELGSVKVSFKGNCMSGSQTIGTFNNVFNGPIDRLEGYDIHNNTFEIGEVHIINTGQRENSNWDYYDESWGPLTRYYLNLCSAAMSYNPDIYANQNVPTYYPVTISTTGLELPRDLNQPTAKQDGMYAFVQGAFYAKANNGDDFYSQYDMVKTEFDGDAILTKPAPHAMIPGTANLFEFAVYDGCAGAYGGWYTVWKNVQLNIGSHKGLELKMNDTYMNNYDLTYSGNIIYHYDSEDYTKYRSVPSITESGVAQLLNDGMVVSGANGVIDVVVEGANVEVYNVAGVKVAEKFVSKQDTFNVGNGLYLVKVGNKTTKVAL